MNRAKLTTLFGIIAGILTLSQTGLAQASINPFGMAFYAEEEDSLVTEFTLHNGSDAAVNFDISLKGGNNNLVRRLAGPRRDDAGEVLQEVELGHIGLLGICRDAVNSTMWVTHTIQDANQAVIDGFITEYEWDGREIGEVLTDIHPGDNQWPLGGTYYDGIVYCTFWQNAFIMRYDRDGNKLDNINLNANAPMGFCVDPVTEYLYTIIFTTVNILVLDINDNFAQVANIPNILGHEGDGDFRARLAWVPEHDEGHIWMSYEFRAYQLNITENWEAERVQDFRVETDIRSFGIGHDGENLWAGKARVPIAMIIDDGIVEPNWLTVSPEVGEIAAGEDALLTISIAPKEIDAGVYDIEIMVSFVEEGIEPITMAIVLSFESPAADIAGTVVVPGSDDPIAGVEVSLGEYLISRWTEDNGHFLLEDLPLGEHQILVTAPDFLPTTQNVDLGEDGLDLNIELYHSEFNLSEDALQADLAPDSDTHIEFSATNDGDGPCTYSIERRLPGNANANPWEARAAINSAQVLEDNRIEGCAFMDGNFFFAGANDADPNIIYITDRDGQPTGLFLQPGQSNFGMKDLDSDGELLWGSGERRIFGFDREGNIEHEFAGPAATNATIAYDTDRDVIWTSTTTSDIFGLTRDGERTDTLDNLGMRSYGLAYWPDDPDGYTLYILNSPDAGLLKVTKMDPETGDTLLARVLDLPAGASPVGASISNTYDNYSWIMTVSLNASPDNGGDRTVVYQLDGRRDWFQVSPAQGVIEPGQTQEFDLHLNAADLPAVLFEGELLITHNGIGSAAIVTVELNVVEGPVIAERVIQLSSGWNLISTNVQPDPNDMVEITQGLVDQGLLDLVKDDRGRFYRPASHFSNLDPWLVSEGYWLKLNEATELSLSGLSVEATDPIALAAGWQAISYYPRVPINAVEALSGIANVLVICKDGAGNFYLPQFGFSNMGNMRESRGYQIRVSQAVDLVYNIGDRLASQDVVNHRSVYENPGRYSPPDPSINNMSLLIQTKLADGTNIGVYANDRLVGCGVVNAGLAGVAVIGDDQQTTEVEGAVTGELLAVRVLDDAGERSASISLVQGNLTYSTDEFAVVAVDAAQTPVAFGLTKVYPNPFNARLTANFDLPVAGMIEAGIFDLSGREVLHLISDNMPAGSHQIAVSGENLASGVYILQIKATNTRSQMKIALIK